MAWKAIQVAIVFGFTCALAAQETTATSPQDQTAASAEKPRVFITDSESWEMSGSAGGSNGSFAAQTHGGARPQTAEIIKTFGERCSEVIINNKQDFADYIVVLDHEGGKGYLRHRNKVAVFERLSGDAVTSHSTLSLGGSVEDACNGIIAHWGQHRTEIQIAKQKAQSKQIPAPALTPVAVSQGPQSSQVSISVDSTPAGADIEVDGEFVGSTPSTITVAPGAHEIAVRKKGFADWSRKMNVTGGTVHLTAELEQKQQPAQ
jgi:hypothetical protein